MNTYRMRGQLKPLQEFNIRNEIQNLRNQIPEMEKQIKFEQNSKEKSRLETKLRDLQGQLRQAQAKLVIAGFRVEVWDDDEKFDDRLASGKTDSTGWFEYEFSEEDFRQQFLDLDWSPDLFFKVYQGRDPICASQPRPNIPLPSDINVPLRLDPFELLTEDEKESGYRLENVTIQLLENQEQEDRPRQAFQERAIAVYDILPTANQLVGQCHPSSPPFVDKNDCSLEHIVDCALAEILGRNLKNDPKAFVATLNKNFTAKVNNGYTEDVAFPLPDGTGYLKRDLVNLVPPMTVEGLLTWVWRFGSEEGPALAKAGGKLGIAKGIVDTATKLMVLVQAASFTPVSSNAFRREGVLRALRDLAMQLYQVKELAKQIIPPSTNYEPDAIDQLPQRSSGSVTIPMRRI